jgi:hypothetical protein
MTTGALYALFQAAQDELTHAEAVLTVAEEAVAQAKAQVEKAEAKEDAAWTAYVQAAGCSLASVPRRHRGWELNFQTGKVTDIVR